MKSVKKKPILNNNLIISASKYLFDINHLKDTQLKIIKDIIYGKDVMAVLPTGYGKSLCFITAGTILKEKTLIISPLIQLMNQQKNIINQRLGKNKAVVLSEIKKESLKNRIDEALFVFTSPEKMEIEEEIIAGYRFRNIVIDEAHCLSLWSDDFRPAYSRISKIITRLISNNKDSHSIICLTATANEEIIKDVMNMIPFRVKMQQYNKSCYRKNISIYTIKACGIIEKFAYLLYYISRMEFPGIIYCPTKDSVEITYQFLKSFNYPIQKYHSKLVSKKNQVLDNFMNNDNLTTITTNALGMGINKKNLRFVIHLALTLSPEAYIQEIGRTGRDGLPSSAILFYDKKDIELLRKLIDKNKPSLNKYHKVYSSLNKIQGRSLSKISFISNAGIKETRNILENLKDTSIVKKKAGLYYKSKPLKKENMKISDKKRHNKYQKLNSMNDYAKLDQNSSKWEWLMKYMGYKFTMKDKINNTLFSSDWIDKDIDISFYQDKVYQFLNSYNPILPKSTHFEIGYAISLYTNIESHESKRTGIGEELCQTKYHNKTEISQKWVEIASSMVRNKYPKNIDFLCIVPSFSNHTFMKKFTLDLEKELNKCHFKLKFINVIERIKNIRPQKNMKTLKRKVHNVKNAFFIDEKYFPILKGKNVLLIDDIYDTGKTIDECSKKLIEMKVNNIYVFTLVKTLI
jgi:ATP-dependent DNA helicase RecQ